MFPGNFASFELAFETQRQQAKALIGGKKQVVASAITEELASLKLTFEFADWATVQMALDEQAADETAVPWQEIRTVKVPATTPFEVVDADISVSTAPSITAFRASKGTWGGTGFLTKVGVAPIDADKFQVNAATSKLVFHSSLAGAIVTYSITLPKTVSSIGNTSVGNSFGALQFSGLCYTTETSKPLGIVIPNITRNSKPSLSFTGGLTVLEINFDANVEPGKRLPYSLFNFS